MWDAVRLHSSKGDFSGDDGQSGKYHPFRESYKGVRFFPVSSYVVPGVVTETFRKIFAVVLIVGGAFLYHLSFMKVGGYYYGWNT